MSLTELPNVHNIILVLQHGRLVVVNVQVIWSTEDGHDTREASSSCLAVHSVASVLRFMGTNDRQQVVLLQERASSGVGEEVRTASDMVVDEILLRLFLTKVLQRVCPEKIAHETVGWWLSESVNLV